MELEVFLSERRVGILAQAPGGDFYFTYDATWVADPERFALSPYLPLPGEVKDRGWSSSGEQHVGFCDLFTPSRTAHVHRQPSVCPFRTVRYA